MSTNWPWLEEIEDFYKPCSIEGCDCDNRHDYAVRKLISCIHEMRNGLSRIRNISQSKDYYITALIASEILTRCAEGKFRQDSDKGDVR